MKRVLILLGLLLILPTVLAVDLTVEKQTQNEVMIVDANEPALVELKVTNNGLTDNFLFYTFFGTGLEPTERIEIKADETKDIILKFYPRPDYAIRDFTSFDYFIQGTDNSEQKERITINVIDVQEAFEIGAEEIDPESNKMIIFVHNKVNFGFDKVNAKFDSAFFKVDSEFTLGPNEKKVFEVSLNKEEFDQLMAGFYTLKAELTYKDVVANLETQIKFTEKDILKTSSESYGFIINTKIIKKTNEGNVVLDSTTKVKKNIVSRLFTTFNPTPTLSEREGAKIYYTWNNQVLPGETLEIKVRTNWIIPFLILVLLIIIIVLSKIYSGRYLVLRKKVKFVRAKGGEFALKVSIIVQSKKYLEKVNIVDRLPPLVKMHERFGAEQPSKIDEHKKRIEWNFEKLEEGERRVLTYIIYSKVGVLGRFALPRATAIFERDGKIKESSSNKSFFVAEQVVRKGAE